MLPADLLVWLSSPLCKIFLTRFARFGVSEVFIKFPRVDAANKGRGILKPQETPSMQLVLV